MPQPLPFADYVKSAPGLPPQARQDTADTVQIMLARIKTGGEPVALDFAERLDGYTGPVVVTAEEIERAVSRVPEQVRQDIAYAHANIILQGKG